MGVRRWLGNGALLGAGFLVSLILLEILTRILLPPHPIYRSPQIRHDRDPLIGYVIRPNQEAYTHDKLAHINAQGLRRPLDLPAESSPGVRRILVLGDSFTFGNGVNDDETYPAVLERLLKQHGIDADVLNAGVQGYGVQEEAAWLRYRGLALRPDAVIVGFYANDLVLRRELEQVWKSWDDEGRFVQPGLRGFLGDEVTYLLKRLRFVSFLGHAASELKYRFFAPESDYWAKAVLHDRETAESRRMWDDVKDFLVQIRDLCTEHRIALIVLIQPAPWQMSPGSLTKTYQGHLHELLDSLGIASVDDLAAYREAVGRGEEPFIPYDGHPSTLGQRISAAALVGPVLKAIAPTQAPPDAGGGRSSPTP